MVNVSDIQNSEKSKKNTFINLLTTAYIILNKIILGKGIVVLSLICTHIFDIAIFAFFLEILV